MRVTFLVSCLTHGGAEKVASLWINGFVSRGYETSCILSSGNAPISYKIPKSVNVKRVQSEGQGIRHNIRQIHEIRQFVKELKPDVMITVIHPLGLFAKIACVGLGITIINTEHNTFDRPPYVPFSFRQKFDKFYTNRIFKRVTIFTKADLKYIGSRLKNTVFLPNPLSIEPVKEIPTKNNIILAVGRMEAWHVKGFDLLIEAWGDLYNKYPDWKLQILGGGEQKYRDKLIKMAEMNGSINSIDFCDFTPNPTEYFKNASVFVLSSRYEGFGMVLLEAMSQGCACVSCDYKGRQSEIIPSKKYGITCETDSPTALRTAIEEMLGNREYRESIRMNSIHRSKYYSLDNIMDRWEEIIQEI